MLDELLLLSGNDVPFYAAQITIHVPTLKEIGMIGEESFFAGCEMLNFSKDSLSEEDKNNLINQSDFDVFMSIMAGKQQTAIQKYKINALMVLSLLFPDYQINFNRQEIILIKEDETHSINNENFENFKEIITDIFCLNGSSDDNPEYNPKGDLASKIADKLKERQKKLAQLNNEANGKISILSRYASILAVGQRKDLNDIMKYTVYQLFDEMKRFDLKEEFDFYVKAKLAGARDLQEVEHWKKDIH